MYIVVFKIIPTGGGGEGAGDVLKGRPTTAFVKKKSCVSCTK